MNQASSMVTSHTLPPVTEVAAATVLWAANWAAVRLVVVTTVAVPDVRLALA